MPSTQTRLLLFVVWLCFLARGAFYSAAFPIWEGFDEWAHFAVIQRMVERGEVLVPRRSPISREIAASLELAPVPWELRNLSPHLFTGFVTEDIYWRLSEDERARRESGFYLIPRSWANQDAGNDLPAYEALQPPLYYWIASPLLRLLAGFDLGTRVLLLRWFGIALASFVIPLCFLAGRVAFSDDSLGVACAAIVAAMPEFLIDVARVGNECAGVVCWSVLTWLVVISVRDGMNRARAVSIGATLGAGLLIKAYFLAAIPTVALLIAYDLWSARAKIRPAITRAVLTSSCAFAISGWWYIRNMIQTGTLSGLGESETLRNVSAAGLFARATEINWAAAIDSILFSHLWFGGWSSLGIRGWMYHVFYVFIVLAVVGVLRQSGKRVILALTILYATFWLGELYNVLLLFAAKGMATSMGWYLYAVIAAEVVLAVAGLRAVAPTAVRRYVPLIGIGLFVLLDLYSLHAIALPYYSGLIAHRPNGSLQALHVVDIARVGFSGILTRLTAYKSRILSEWMLVFLWSVYLAATGGLLAVGVFCSATKETRKSAPAPIAKAASSCLNV